MFHATSPAVPLSATSRVRRYAELHGWNLLVAGTGEFSDARYRNNPVDRCYFCKSNLYDRIRSMIQGTIASGANTDDLADYRPGLTAAAERAIVHPLVDAGIDIEVSSEHLENSDLKEAATRLCAEMKRSLADIRAYERGSAFVGKPSFASAPDHA